MISFAFSFTDLDDAACELRDTSDTISSLYIGSVSQPSAASDTQTDALLVEISNLTNQGLESLGLECLRLAVIIEYIRHVLAENEKCQVERWNTNRETDET